MRYTLLLVLAIVLNTSAFSQTGEIISISPTTVMQGDTVSFTVIAHNMYFTNSAEAEITSGPGTAYTIRPLSQQVLNDTTAIFKCFMSYRIPSGSLNICLKNSNQTVWKYSYINLIPGPLPQSFTITPNSARQGDTVQITIKGTNTHFKPFTGGDGTNIIHTQKSSFQTAAFTYINDSLLTVTYAFEYKDYKDAVGVYDFSVNDSYPNPPMKLSGGFTIYPGPNPPSPNSFAPATAKQGELVTIRISARNTHFLSENNGVSLFAAFNPSPFRTISAEAVRVLNDSTLDADFAFNYNAYPNDYKLIVSNQKDGYLDFINSFTIASGNTPPVIKSVSPSMARKGQQIKMRIIGEHTFFMHGHPLLWPVEVFLRDPQYRNLASDTLEIVNDTLMIARFTFSNSALIGKYDLIVPYTKFSPDMSLLKCFTLYPDGATLLSISPTNAVIGDTIQLTVNAFNAHYLSGTTTVKLQSIFGGPPIDGTQLNVINDSTLRVKFIFADSVYNGKYTLIVKNDIDSTKKLDACFTLNVSPTLPQILNIYPNSCAYRTIETFTITASGTHFKQGDVVKLSQGSYSVSPTTITVINDTVVEATFNMPSEYDLPYNKSYLDLSIEGSGSRLVYEHGVSLYMIMAVPKIEDQSEFHIYPNPSPGLFHIQLKGEATVSELEVIDITGRIILKQKNTAKTIDIDISSFSSGIYYLKLFNATTSKTIKLIKD
ncbi:MAG: T9SS type A sorting domain-containing protein [Bacteroidia bacterium]